MLVLHAALKGGCIIALGVGLPADSARVIDDDTWGAMCIYAESRSEPYEGQVEVGRCIRYRTAKRFFSDGTVVGTVFSPHQFSWTNTVDAQRTRVLQVKKSDPAWQEAVRAWEESGRVSLDDAPSHYHASYVSPYWAKVHGMRFLKRIGRHLFYRDEEI